MSQGGITYDTIAFDAELKRGVFTDWSRSAILTERSQDADMFSDKYYIASNTVSVE